MNEVLPAITALSAAVLLAYLYARSRRVPSTAPVSTLLPVVPADNSLAEMLAPAQPTGRADVVSYGRVLLDQYGADEQTALFVIAVEPDGLTQTAASGSNINHALAIGGLLSCLTRVDPGYATAASVCRQALNIRTGPSA